MTSQALDPITIKGSKFFYSNGTQFFIRGVTYSSSFEDNLADGSGCFRDIASLVFLGINVLHVSGIDASQDHVTCMQKFMENGIYLLVDLPTTSSYISPDFPTWTNNKFAAYTAVVDAFASYTNTLGFVLVDNSISDNTTDLAPLLKGALRDVKLYIKAQGYRSIPIGGYISTNTGASANTYRLSASYMACGNSSDSFIEFWALIDYSWCNNSTFISSNYSRLAIGFTDYPLPVSFAQYTCAPHEGGDDNISNHTFDEVSTIYGPKMSNIWSGGIVFQWASSDDRGSNWALVNVTNNEVQLNQYYRALSTQLASISPSAATTYVPTMTTARSCPSQGAVWAAPTTLPPTANTQLCDCMVNSLHCIVNSTASIITISSVMPTLCSQNSTVCDGFHSNSANGIYGAFSVCSSWQQISWALNQQYLNTGNCSGNTSFASIQTPAVLNSSCSDLLTRVGPLGDIPIYPDLTILNSTSPSNTTTTDPQTPQNASTLPRSTIAGIVVGVLLAAVATCSFTIIYLRKRKQRELHIADGIEVAPPGHPHTRAELGNEGQKSELWAQEVAAELRAPVFREHELENEPVCTGSESTEICEMP